MVHRMIQHHRSTNLIVPTPPLRREERWIVSFKLKNMFSLLLLSFSGVSALQVTMTASNTDRRALIGGMLSTGVATAVSAYELPDLPYSFDALEPSIDAATMKIHHDKCVIIFWQKRN